MAEIANIYSGFATINGGGSGAGFEYIDVSLPAAVSAQNKCEIIFDYYCNFSGDDPNEVNLNGGFNGASTSQLRFRRYNTSPTSTIIVSWRVIEYASGVTVQHGISNTTTTENITVSSVNLSKSWSRQSFYNAGSAYGNDDSMSSELTTATNLLLTVGSGQSGPERRWQVVEYDNCTVQKVTGSVGTGSTSATVTFSSVDMSKSLVKGEYSLGGSPGGFDEFAKLTLTSATQATWSRVSTGIALNHVTYLIEFTDNIAVTRGTTSITPGNTLDLISISAVDVSRTYLCGAGDYIGAMQSSDNAGMVASGSFCYLLLSTATEIYAVRGNNTDTTSVSWQCSNGWVNLSQLRSFIRSGIKSVIKLAINKSNLQKEKQKCLNK